MPSRYSDIRIPGMVALLLALSGCDRGGPAEAEPPPAASEPQTEKTPTAPRTSWSGAKVYDEVCDLCHKMGVDGAPIVGNRSAWSARIAKGEEVLYRHVEQGFNKMPARGRCEFCSDQQLRAATRHMIANSR